MRDISTLPMDAQADLMAMLQQLSRITATSNTPELLITQLAAAIGQAFQADGCIVMGFKSRLEPAAVSCWSAASAVISDRQLSSLQAAVLHQPSPPSEPDVVDPAAISGLGATVKPLATSVWQQVQNPESSATTATVLELSTQFQGTPNGLISLMRSHLHLWSSTEIAKLEILGAQLAATFAQMQLQHHVEKQFQYQDVVNQLTLAIRNASDVTAVLKLAIQGTAQALQVEHGMLLRFKYADPLFRNHAPEDIPKARVTVTSEWFDTSRPRPLDSSPLDPIPTRLHQSFWLSDCQLCQHAFQTAYPIIMPDRQGWERYNIPAAPSDYPHLVHLNSFIIARLESQGTVLGLLLFQDSRPRDWEQSEIELVDLVSAQVSNAIIQTETLRQVQSLVEKRTADLQHSLTIQAKLYERTRQQVEQLRQVNQLKDEFLDTVSHELRTPLTSMSLAIRMLRQVGPDSDRSQRYLDILEQQCAQETNLVNDLLALRELESQRVTMQVEDINLVALIEELAATFRQRWAADGLTLNLEFPDHPVRIRSDRDSLTRVLVELLTNAGKYSSPQQPVQLKLIYRHEVPTNQIILSLCNTGSGISSEELPYIFDKFRRCEGATQNAIQGTGLGLALVKSLVQHLNGTISAASAPLEPGSDWETCFSLILPQSLELVQR